MSELKPCCNNPTIVQQGIYVGLTGRYSYLIVCLECKRIATKFDEDEQMAKEFTISAWNRATKDGKE